MTFIDGGNKSIMLQMTWSICCWWSSILTKTWVLWSEVEAPVKYFRNCGFLTYSSNFFKKVKN